MNWILSKKEDKLDLLVKKNLKAKALKVNKTNIDKIEYCYNYITTYGAVFDSIEDNGRTFYIVMPNGGRN